LDWSGLGLFTHTNTLTHSHRERERWVLVFLHIFSYECITIFILQSGQREGGWGIKRDIPRAQLISMQRKQH